MLQLEIKSARVNRGFDSHRGQANFSACPVWMHTRVTPQTSYSPEYITPTHTQKAEYQIVKIAYKIFIDIFSKFNKSLQNRKAL